MQRDRWLTIGFCLTLSLPVVNPIASGQTREEKVRADRAKVEAEGFWIYNDLNRGIEQARESGKPIVVALRCIPCEECVKLDEDLMEKDPDLRPLLDQFVRVRIVGTNGLDLSTFQFDYDQSFAVFLMNADQMIYGRFGTRSHRTVWSDDVSIEGLAKAMQKALELHKEYPKNKKMFAGKRGSKPKYPSPEKYPSLAEKYTATLNYEGNVVQSCIHCHQIGDAQRLVYRETQQPIPEQVLFQYPHPKILGLILDPKEMAKVQEVIPDSTAEKCGFQPGDELVTLQGQPILSIADVQWVLHHAKAKDKLAAEVQRGEQQVALTLELPEGWRTRDDLSWRATTWPLRRMATGGLLLEPATNEQRRQAGVTDKQMALHIKHVGQFGPHAAAKRAGFQQGDIMLSFGNRFDFQRETDLIVYALQNFTPGQRIPVTVARNGKKLQLVLPMQK